MAEIVFRFTSSAYLPKFMNMESIVSLCKRRGFIYPGSEIYGGFANTYTYGPYGSQLKKNIKDLWWKMFVHMRSDMVGMDGPILLHPRAWEASGHVAGFNDALIDCKQCKSRFRADHLIEDALNMDCEGLNEESLTTLITDNKIVCPKCGQHDFTPARNFNLMFKTQLSKTNKGEEGESIAYLRPETAQAMFLEFKNVVDTTRVKLPFGMAQIGKAFRNEITPGNFIFRLIEFEQMEIEYFIRPGEWEETFESWLQDQLEWCAAIGLSSQYLSQYEHPQEKLSHYSKRTVDIMFDFPFGRSELYGLAYRTDFDLQQHAEHSGKNLEYRDPQTNETFIPHVIEPTWGLDRTVLAVLCSAYEEESLENGDSRTVLRLDSKIAPVSIAVLPLMKKDGLAEKAQEIYQQLSQQFRVEYDQSGSIGKRYRRQDEIGTPFCLTVDYDTLQSDNAVSIRYRDSMEQKRVDIKGLLEFFVKELNN